MERTMVELDTVELSEFYAGVTNLKCPRCGWDHMHQRCVTVYNRDEDEDVTAVTTVAGGLSATHLLPSAGLDNPSARRQGIVIALECEDCGGDIKLTLAQHKGVTLIGWRHITKGKPFSGSLG